MLGTASPAFTRRLRVPQGPCAVRALRRCPSWSLDLASVLFVVNNLLAATVSVCAADLAMSGREPWRRILAYVAGFPAVAVGVMLLLGALGQLTAPAVTTLLAPAAAGMAIWRWRRQETMGAPLVPSIATGSDGAGGMMWLPALGLAGGLGGVFLAKTCFSGTSFQWDDLSYHAPAVAQWLADERLSLAPFSYHSYYPFNAELLSLWYVLPFRADGSSSLAALTWLAVTVVAIAALVSAAGSGRTAAALSVALFLASPEVLKAAQTFSAVDLAGPAMILVAIAFALPSDTDNRYAGRDAVYCGLACAFAAGCRVAFVPASALIFFWFILLRQRGTDGISRAKTAALFALAAAALASCWYIRNLILTGNPLFPAELGPFAGPLSAERMHRSKLLTWMLRAPHDTQILRYLLKTLVAWPVGLFLLAALGYAAGLHRLLVSRLRSAPTKAARGISTRPARRRRPVVDQQPVNPTGCTTTSPYALLLLVGVLLLVLYPLMPFSGTSNSANAPLVVRLRYAITPFLIGIVLFSSLTGSLSTRPGFWCAAAILAAMTAAHHLDAKSPPILLLSGVVLMFLWSIGRRVALPPWTRPLCVPFLIAAASFVLALWVPKQQELTDRRLYSQGSRRKPIGAAWQAVDKLPQGAILTWFGPGAYQYYALFGRNYQLIPQRVRSTGRTWTTEYDEWRQRLERDAAGIARQPPTDQEFVDNLVSGGIQYVFVTKWDGNKWPSQQDILAGSDRAQAIYQDGYSTIWRLRP